MKSNVRLIGIFALVTLIGLLMMACDMDMGNTVTFDNRSRYEVSVWSNDISPSSFTIAAGNTKTAKATKGYITIQYTPANLVNVSSGANKFTFTNK
ncbi:MAG: hypothetical protein FWG46_02925 [Treponema sp.]|nr:hypothetical protein [Treponema sp.]